MASHTVLALALLAIFLCVCVTHSQKCLTEEPSPTDVSDAKPDVNITVSSGLVARVGDKILITCIADKPRYTFPPSTPGAKRPSDPSRVTVLFNMTEQNNCSPRGGRAECILNVTLTETGQNLSVFCRAQNDDGCRIKTVFLTVLEASNQNSSTDAPATSFSPVVMSTAAEMTSLSSFTSDVQSTSHIPLPSSPMTTSSVSKPTITNTGETGLNQKEESEDEDDLDDVKKLITATLIIVIVMLILMTVAIVYALRQIKN